jgi:hypothetical protein
VEEGGEFLNIDVLHYDPATAAIDERAPVFAPPAMDHASVLVPSTINHAPVLARNAPVPSSLLSFLQDILPILWTRGPGQMRTVTGEHGQSMHD